MSPCPTRITGVQVFSLDRGDARRRRAHAHDPKGPVTNDGQIASGAAVLRSCGGNIEGTCRRAFALAKNLRQNPIESLHKQDLLLDSRKGAA